MSKIKEANVLVTGGGNGIGKQMGLKCLQDGCANLVIWDINKDNLDKTKKDFSNRGFKNVHTFLVDVSDIDDVEKAGTEVLLEIGNIDILINNAGIVAGTKSFWDYTAKDIDRTVDINIKGVMYVTRVFIKEMLRQKKGHVVNIVSASAYLGLPKGSVYASSKWGAIGWSESLRLELEREEGDLHVTAVCPSYIDTGMFKGVKAPLLFPLLEPENTAERIIKAVKSNQVHLLLPDTLNLVPVLKGIFSPKIFDVVADWLGVYTSMNSFEGRAEKERIPESKKQKSK